MQSEKFKPEKFEEGTYRTITINGNKGAKVKEENISALRKFGNFLRKTFKPNVEDLVEKLEQAYKEKKSYSAVNKIFDDARYALKNDKELKNSNVMISRISTVGALNELNKIVSDAEKDIRSLTVDDVNEFDKSFRSLSDSSSELAIERNNYVDLLFKTTVEQLSSIEDDDVVLKLTQLFQKTKSLEQTTYADRFYQKIYKKNYERILKLRNAIEDKKENEESYVEDAKKLIDEIEKINEKSKNGFVIFEGLATELQTYVTDQELCLSIINDGEELINKFENGNYPTKEQVDRYLLSLGKTNLKDRRLENIKLNLENKDNEMQDILNNLELELNMCFLGIEKNLNYEESAKKSLRNIDIVNQYFGNVFYQGEREKLEQYLQREPEKVEEEPVHEETEEIVQEDESKVEPSVITDESVEGLDEAIEKVNDMMKDFAHLLSSGAFVREGNGALLAQGNKVIENLQKLEELIEAKQTLDATFKQLENLTEEERKDVANNVKELLKQKVITEDMAEEYNKKLENLQTKKEEPMNLDNIINQFVTLSSAEITDPVAFSNECDELLKAIESYKANNIMPKFNFSGIETRLYKLKQVAVEAQLSPKNNLQKEINELKHKKAYFENRVKELVESSEFIDNGKSLQELKELYSKINYLDQEIFALEKEQRRVDYKVNKSVEEHKNKEKEYNENGPFFRAKYFQDQEKIWKNLSQRAKKEDISEELAIEEGRLLESKINFSEAEYNSLLELCEQAKMDNEYYNKVRERKNTLHELKQLRSEEKELREDEARKRKVATAGFETELLKWENLLQRLNSGEDVHSEESDFLPEYGKACVIFENNRQYYDNEQLSVLENLINEVQTAVWKPEVSKTR